MWTKFCDFRTIYTVHLIWLPKGPDYVENVPAYVCKLSFCAKQIIVVYLNFF